MKNTRSSGDEENPNNKPYKDSALSLTLGAIAVVAGGLVGLTDGEKHPHDPMVYLELAQAARAEKVQLIGG